MTAAARVPSTRLRDLAGAERVGSVIVAALVAHAGLGLVLRWSSIAATVYAVAAIAAAFVVIVRTRDVDLVAISVAYVVATEVLWRMTSAHFFFEGAKYALAALLIVAAVRFFPGWRSALVPGIYLATFVPALVLSARHFGGIVAAREPISFNFAGPLALAVAVWFFSPVRMTVERFRVVLWAVVLPITSIATITLANTIAARSITFDLNANLTTSGGFSPNEVCSALGFGVVAGVLLAATERNPRLRVLEIGLSVWLFGAAVLTFSRGGVANVIAALLLALVLMAGRGRNVGRFALVAVVVVVAVGLLLPLLNDFTGGHLLDRYQYTSSSKRDLIVEDDLHQFREHPLVGVGIGVSPEHRPPNVGNQEAHTEYTRLLAEQGVLGMVALGALVAMVVGAFRRAGRGLPRALVAAFVAWAFTEMTHSATRLAFTSFAIGVAALAAGLVVTEPDAPED